ncbi:MAG: class I SAM-dependent methyltransferase [bacterium]|nr:class I SAM-dependent methyltransferase [bacterium]
MSRIEETFIKENFTDVKLTLTNLWMYQVRKNLFKAIINQSKEFKGRLLDVGCGVMPYKQTLINSKHITSYVGLDLEQTNYYEDVKPDVTWDGIVMPFENKSFDTIMATEVLEHSYEPEKLLNEIYRVLKPGGVFFCTVPFIWHLHETPHDEYRYTPFSLEKKLKGAGFEKIEIRALGGWDSALSQLLGLWVTYRPMRGFMKRIMLRVAKFSIRYLDKNDVAPRVFDTKENSMISGLSAICYKKGDG